MLYSELYRVLWRTRALVLGGTLVCVALALLLTSQQEKSYTATATVRVEPAETNNANDSFEASQRLSRSYAEIYQQGAVLAEMAPYMGNQAPPARSELAAQQLKDLDLLEVSGVADDPRRAVAIANAGARALEEFSPRERLLPITPATLPDGASSPNVRLSVLLGLVGGLIISAGMALVLNALLQPLPDADELENSLGMPVLAVIPRLDLSVEASGPPHYGGRTSSDASGDREVAGVGAFDDLPKRWYARRGERS